MILFRRVNWMLVLALIVCVTATTRPVWIAEGEAEEAIKPLPVKVGIEYKLVTDYVWRGINLSEYRGEGREKINHQIDLNAKVKLEDLGLPDVGWVKAGVWFQIFQGNESQNPGPPTHADNNLQEVPSPLQPLPRTPGRRAHRRQPRCVPIPRRLGGRLSTGAGRPGHACPRRLGQSSRPPGPRRHRNHLHRRAPVKPNGTGH